MRQTKEARILELEGDIDTLRQEQSALSRSLRLSQRQGSIFRALKDELHKVVTPLKPLPQTKPWIKPGKSLIEESLVLHLSDEHADETVLPHQVGGLENYNFSVALARAERLVKTVIKFSQHTLAGYRFPVLNILSNGDHSSGEIHGSVTHSEYKNQFRNSLAIGQMQGLMVRDLAPYFKQINVICVSGNHGRRSVKKDFHNPWDNWDYLISEVAAQHCRELKNVTFKIPDSFSVNFDIEGHGFCLFHGDDIMSWNGIPWYGLERKTRRLVALESSQSKRVKYFACGHFHKPTTTADLDGELIINGSWKATDPYVYNSFSSFVTPSQILHGVHEEHGLTWRLNVHLRPTDRSAETPERYRVLLAEPQG